MSIKLDGVDFTRGGSVETEENWKEGDDIFFPAPATHELPLPEALMRRAKEQVAVLTAISAGCNTVMAINSHTGLNPMLIKRHLDLFVRDKLVVLDKTLARYDIAPLESGDSNNG